jgi:hypothetical protein
VIATALGRSESESGPHAVEAARRAGWGSGDVLELGPIAATLETVSQFGDLGAVVHLDHPQQPSPDLERALLTSPHGVLAVAAVAVDRQWVWIGRAGTNVGSNPGTVGGAGAGARIRASAVIVDEAGMRDCRHLLRALGASPRLVPTGTPVAERQVLAGENGTLLVERSAIPAGYVELPASSRLVDPSPLWYGLVAARPETPVFESVAQVWLALGPPGDHRGSLQQTLALVAETGIDLQHLRSHRSHAGPHVFFTSFSCPTSTVLTELVAGLAERGVAHRVLAVLPGASFEPGPVTVAPRWTEGVAA